MGETVRDGSERTGNSERRRGRRRSDSSENDFEAVTLGSIAGRYCHDEWNASSATRFETSVYRRNRFRSTTSFCAFSRTSSIHLTRKSTSSHHSSCYTAKSIGQRSPTSNSAFPSVLLCLASSRFALHGGNSAIWKEATTSDASCCPRIDSRRCSNRRSTSEYFHLSSSSCSFALAKTRSSSRPFNTDVHFRR